MPRRDGGELIDWRPPGQGRGHVTGTARGGACRAPPLGFYRVFIYRVSSFWPTKAARKTKVLVRVFADARDSHGRCWGFLGWRPRVVTELLPSCYRVVTEFFFFYRGSSRWVDHVTTPEMLEMLAMPGMPAMLAKVLANRIAIGNAGAPDANIREPSGMLGMLGMLGMPAMPRRLQASAQRTAAMPESDARDAPLHPMPIDFFKNYFCAFF